MRSAWMTNRTDFDTNGPMAVDRNANEVAMQYLVWALEDIEKAGNRKAARHVRIALEALRKGPHCSPDKTDGQAS
jgi:hypothetical protein